MIFMMLWLTVNNTLQVTFGLLSTLAAIRVNITSNTPELGVDYRIMPILDTQRLRTKARDLQQARISQRAVILRVKAVLKLG